MPWFGTHFTTSGQETEWALSQPKSPHGVKNTDFTVSGEQISKLKERKRHQQGL